MKKRGIHFYEGIPELSDLTKWFPKGGILVMDDLMDEGGSDKRVLDLFTKHSHHRNIRVLYLSQDMFPPGKYAKSISRNVHYIVAFKNPRDGLRIRNLLLQSFPSIGRICFVSSVRLRHDLLAISNWIFTPRHPMTSDSTAIY